MSYDIELTDSVTGEVLQTEEKHFIAGGTHVVGGTRDLWVNITYNYSQIFHDTLGEDGIRTIYNKTGAESIPILKEAISKLKDDVDKDYWKATEGNAKQALCGLLAFAQLRPDGIWKGD
jgi:hypothetical protein